MRGAVFLLLAAAPCIALAAIPAFLVIPLQALAVDAVQMAGTVLLTIIGLWAIKKMRSALSL